MFGAIYGDVIGSYYEIHCTKDYNFKFHRESTFTDDSVLTVAVCKAILNNPKNIGIFELNKRAMEYALMYRQYYSYYPNAGYGSMFISWANKKSITRNHSYGNGAAMRVIPIGYAYQTVEQVMMQAKASCLYTHKNQEAVKGAQAVAVSVRLALDGYTKEEIRHFISQKFSYDLSPSISQLRPDYTFDSRTKYSVPPSIIAFLDSNDYESAVRNAVSLGGDADTMACIAGGIAQAYYGTIPENIKNFCDNKLDSSVRLTVREFEKQYAKKKGIV